MSKVIDRIRAKVTRAKQHIQDLDLALKAFDDSNPHRIGIKEETQTDHTTYDVRSPDGHREIRTTDSETTIRIYYVVEVADVPDKAAAIAADVLKNLREPLDHLAFQLVLAARSGTRPKSVYYPITDDAAKYPARRNGMLKGVRQEVIDAIDATEPYKGGNGHAVWQLNALNNIDKHQLLVATGAILTSVELTSSIHPRHKVGLRLGIKPTFPLIKGAELFRTVVNPMLDEPRFAFDVSFNDSAIIQCEPVLKSLQDMANAVDDVIAQLARFLP